LGGGEREMTSKLAFEMKIISWFFAQKTVQYQLSLHV
jgi:hypothetical protein